MIRRLIVPALITAIVASVPGATALAQSGSAVPAGITLDHGWTVVTTAPGRTTPAYFSIHNAGTTPDTLVSTTCPIAHHTLMLDAAGAPLGAMAIKPGQTVTLAPGGVHLMLQQNRFRFYTHAMIPCSVDFLNAGKIILYLHVEADGSTGFEPARRPIVKN
ncbi:copper chaperone PCu(A)C [Acidiphilium sp.]|uniref:copper chaperone PCu(A)C n=1 Tax=Acidiphilium sp. TaxID=527 RepID=UPI003D06CC92